MTPSEKKSNDEFFESLIAPKRKKKAPLEKIISGVKIMTENDLESGEKINPDDKIEPKEKKVEEVSEVKKE